MEVGVGLGVVVRSLILHSPPVDGGGRFMGVKRLSREG